MLRRDGETISKTNLWYQLGDNLEIHCFSLGGYPAPQLEWYEDHQLSQRMIRFAPVTNICWEVIFNIGLFPRSSSSEVTISIQQLTRRHNGTLLTCKAKQVERRHDDSLI